MRLLDWYRGYSERDVETMREKIRQGELYPTPGDIIYLTVAERQAYRRRGMSDDGIAGWLKDLNDGARAILSGR